MPEPKSAWRLAGDALLADGEWHQRDEVLGVMAAAVPPGIAIRRRRATRDHQRAVKGWRFEKPRTVDEEVAIGARSLCGSTLTAAVKHRAWVVEGDKVRAATTPSIEEVVA